MLCVRSFKGNRTQQGPYRDNYPKICACSLVGSRTDAGGRFWQVSSSSLGTFMTEAGHFSSETVRNMQVALDLAWSSLSPEQQSQSSKMEVATRILNAAEAGERSPARLLMLALLPAFGT